MGGILILIAFYQDGDGKLTLNHPQSEIEDVTRNLYSFLGAEVKYLAGKSYPSYVPFFPRARRMLHSLSP